MGFPLSKLKTDQRINETENFWTIDIEAKNWTQFVVGGVYDGYYFNHFDDIGHMFDFLTDDLKDKRIFAHFGGKYDFLFFIDWLLKEASDEWSFISGIPRGSGLLNFRCEYKNSRSNALVKLEFLDSSALLPFSLKKLTESFDVKHKKTEYDFEKMPDKPDDELIEYLRDDCRGLHEVLTKFYNWELVAKAGRATTMASQAMKVFRTFLDESIKPLDGKNDLFVRESYFGGRTEIFRPFFDSKKFKNKELACYDVNSLYPSVMLGDFPTNLEKTVYKYYPDKMGFYDAEVEVPEDMYIPPLGVKIKVNKSEKLIFPTGRFKGRWSTIELEYARSIGVKIISTGMGKIFKNGGPIFKDYILTLYKMRLAAKDRKDGVTDILTKLLMNSLYGRFGLQTEDREHILEGRDGGKVFYETKNDAGIYTELVTVTSSMNSFKNVAIAAWVTSLARIRMHKEYMKCGHNLWYTDTDSLFTTKTLDDSGLLGDMKKEYEVDKAVFLLPKTYVVENSTKLLKKVTMKGFDKKKTAHFQVEDFIHALEGDLRALRASSPSKFCTFKTAARKGKLLTMSEEAERNIRSKYDKRIFYKNKDGTWDSKPLHIENGKVANLTEEMKSNKALKESEVRV